MNGLRTDPKAGRRDGREPVAFSCAHVTPEETHALLERSALFHPHPTQIKRCVESMGDLIGLDCLDLDACIRSEESIPAQTQVLAASLDGANVLLTEPAERGAKRGRPAERPGAAAEQAATTAYRNAMVGSVTCCPLQRTPVATSVCLTSLSILPCSATVRFSDCVTSRTSPFAPPGPSYGAEVRPPASGDEAHPSSAREILRAPQTSAGNAAKCAPYPSLAS